MLVEEIYRRDMRYTHKSVDFMDVYNFMRGLDDTKFKGEFENTIYLTTKFFHEFINNPLATDKEKSEEKSKVFQAALFHGSFTGNCHAKEIKTLSGLIILDVDHLNDKNELERVRQIFKDNAFVYCCFTSPSATGLKVLIKHNLTINEVSEWKYLFTEIRDYYIHLTDLPENLFDTSGSDVSRICYLPYCSEKDIYLNENCWTWEYKGLFKNVVNDSNNYEYEEVEITEEQYLEWFELSVFLAENSINIAETYGEWRDMGFSLASIGELGRELYHNVSCVSNKYSHSECNKQFDLWLDTYQEGRTNIYRFVNVAKKELKNLTKNNMKNSLVNTLT